jgi:hypothetical protein
MPDPDGSISPNAALTAMAASTALPPRLRMSMPTCAARGWLAATMPWPAMTSERLAPMRPVKRSPPLRGRNSKPNADASIFFMGPPRHGSII